MKSGHSAIETVPDGEDTSGVQVLVMTSPDTEGERISAAIEEILREADITPIVIGGTRQPITPKVGVALGLLLYGPAGSISGTGVGAAIGASHADQQHRESPMRTPDEVDLLIADISQLGPNEMYALGAADAAGKWSIALMREGSQDRLPAVLAGNYVFVYEPGETDRLMGRIRRLVEALRDS
jgi:hypothetical protein